MTRQSDAESPNTEAFPEVESARTRADVPALQRLSEVGDKVARKAAKRALYQLRARGLAIPEKARPAVAASVSPTLTESEEAAYVTPISGEGERLVLLPLRQRQGYSLYVAVLAEDERGLIDLSSLDLSRKQLHRYLAELPSEARAELRALPPAAAVSLLKPALAASPTSAARTLAAHLPPAVPEQLPAASAADWETLDETHLLFEDPALETYLPPRQTLLALMQKLEEVAVSPLYLDEGQRMAQMGRTVDQAVLDFFSAERRARYAARLADLAAYFEFRGSARQAARARAVAAAFHRERSPLQIPFARELFERVLEVETPGHGLAVNPHAPLDAPALEAKATALPRGTLILPR